MVKIVIAVCTTIVVYTILVALAGFWYLSTALEAPEFYTQLLAKEIPPAVRQQQRQQLEEKALKFQQEIFFEPAPIPAPLTSPAATSAAPSDASVSSDLQQPIESVAVDTPPELAPPVPNPRTDPVPTYTDPEFLPDDELEPWSLELTQDEINSWLTDQQSFKLPSEIQQPRIVIEPEQAKIAAKVSQAGLTGYVALSVVPHFENNILTLDLVSLAAGNLQLGVADIAKGIYAQLPAETRSVCELDTSGPITQLRIRFRPQPADKPQLTSVILKPGSFTLLGVRPKTEETPTP